MSQQNMDSKICLVTGASSGIGKATALGLAKLGATVIMVCRDRARGEEAKAEIVDLSKSNKVELCIADLASQAEIKRLANEITDGYPRLDVLVNNAALSPTKRTLTVDGIETAFAVNHLGPFMLTGLLLDKLKKSAPARIVNVASSAHSPIDFNDVQNEKEYKPLNVYSQTKFATILFTYELAKHLEGTGVTVNCLHPGVVSTNLVRDFNLPFRLLAKYFFTTTEKGSRTSLYAATSPEMEGVNGKYLNASKEARSSAETYNEESARRLWQISEELTGVKY